MAKVKTLLAAFGAALLALLMAYSSGRRAQRKSQRLKDAESSLRTKNRSQEIDNAVEKMDDNSARNKLDKWMRDEF